MLWLVGILLGYLLGSISFAYLITWSVAGVDIRTVGDCNPGAANVWRNIGKVWGFLVWLGDTAKGALAILLVALGGNFFPKPVGNQIVLLAVVGCAAVLGHAFPLFFRFKGGKGVATSGGVILCLFPKLFPLVVVLFFAGQRLDSRRRWFYLLGVVIFYLYLWLVYGPGRFGYASLATLFLILTGVAINYSVLVKGNGN